MAIDYKTALLYPYQGKNMENALLFPGLVVYVSMIAGAICVLLILLLLWLVGGQEIEALEQHANGLNVPFNMLLALFFHGFQWHFYGRFQEQGMALEPPSWIEHWKRFFIDGLKVTVFYFMISIPLMIVLTLIILGIGLGVGFSALSDEMKVMMGIGFILFLGVLWFLAMPFWLAPLVQSAKTRKFSDLCNVGAAIRITLPRYGRVLSALLLILLTTILYLVGSLLLTITCIGILLLPFVWAGGLNSTAYHLIAQAFGLHEEETVSLQPNIVSPG